MKTVVIIQARMGSSRLPGKVMKQLCGKTVLGHVIERVKACPSVDQVVVATTEAAQDEIIVAESQRHGAAVFRGSEEDVLARYYGAAEAFAADVVVRVTSDCPLLDHLQLEQLLQQFLVESQQGVDYLSSGLTRTFPRGTEAEIFSFATLERTYREATQKYQREHVTPYIYEHPEIFTLSPVASKEDLSVHRWTLDTEEDLKFIEAVYAALYQEGRLITSAQVLHLLAERPELTLINAHIEQKALDA